MKKGASVRHLRSYSAMLNKRYSRGDGKANYGRERAISYRQRIKSNEGCVFVVRRKLCCLSGNVVIL